MFSNQLLLLLLFQHLEANPGEVNESPHEKGWFIKVQLDANGLKEFNDQLLDEKAYDAHKKELDASH